ncbi:hypothetical protein Y1Q_0000061 [Alligator mississippiensis]|uniref:Uncharacterized protein n=1 Tax=Alligator mississippiensis TaxID=8496 RepID=A0A151M275_ALLMI|nr:hypothetical protein Y1Q_0000061 [Alligator mississippiensis]
MQTAAWQDDDYFYRRSPRAGGGAAVLPEVSGPETGSERSWGLRRRGGFGLEGAPRFTPPVPSSPPALSCV